MYFESAEAQLMMEGRYLCKVDVELTIDPLYLQRFGSPTTRNKKHDSIYYSGGKRVMLTIKEMLDYHVKGVQPYDITQEDLMDIYKIITGYLESWKLRLQVPGNYKAEHFVDLLNACESFNEFVYDGIEDETFLEQYNSKARSFGGLSVQGALELANHEQYRKERLSYEEFNGSIRELLRTRVRQERSIFRK